MDFDLRRRALFSLLAVVFLAGSPTAKLSGVHPPSAVIASSAAAVVQATAPSPPRYETRQVHDPNGTGKFYMGREIAQVMGPGGISWLDRPGRPEEEKSHLVIQALDLRGGETVVDLGAGSGYYTFRLATAVGPSGKVLAVDIQDEMISTLRRRIAEQKVTNVEVIKGSESDPHLAAASVDLVLMVDVYHELAYPYEVMMAVRKALKPGGRVAFVEYRKEDPKVAIKELHKMSLAQLDKEMTAVNLAPLSTIETLPLQHIAIFRKPE